MKQSMLGLVLMFSLISTQSHAFYDGPCSGDNNDCALSSATFAGLSLTSTYAAVFVHGPIALAYTSLVALYLLLDTYYYWEVRDLQYDAMGFLADGESSTELKRFFQTIRENQEIEEDLSDKQIASLLVSLSL